MALKDELVAFGYELVALTVGLVALFQLLVGDSLDIGSIAELASLFVASCSYWLISGFR